MPDESLAVLMTADVTDWQAVADELASALRTTMLRNPNLAARDWDLASAALQRYDGAGRGVAADPTADPRTASG
jgi:hypothetical protein